MCETIRGTSVRTLACATLKPSHRALSRRYAPIRTSRCSISSYKGVVETGKRSNFLATSCAFMLYKRSCMSGLGMSDPALRSRKSQTTSSSPSSILFGVGSACVAVFSESGSASEITLSTHDST